MLRTKYLIAASVEIKLTLFKAIKEYKLSEDSSMPRNKAIKLLKKKGFYINSTLKDLAKNDRCIVSTKI